MKQFYEAYKESPIFSTVLKELPWSHNLVIFSRCKTDEERAYYLQKTRDERYSFRELDRQINASQFERTKLGSKLSPLVRELHPGVVDAFKQKLREGMDNMREDQDDDLTQQRKNLWDKFKYNGLGLVVPPLAYLIKLATSGLD
jgi:predicted nuclease of restriction endonuclease-like (RecB) superfamily